MGDTFKKDNNIDILMQSRQLVHTSYEVTAIQNRIFYFCLLRAQRENTGELNCTVKIEELKKLIPSKPLRTLDNIKKTLQVLKQTALIWEQNDDDGEKEENDYNLIIGTTYKPAKESFNIKFSDKLYRHLIDYTVYAPLNLDIITKFKSFYSQRLYELLRLWSRTDKAIIKKFKIEKLRFILSVENKYPEYKNFKQRVLNQAIKEINTMGNMKVNVKEIKNGRKVEELEFTIIDYEKKVYFKNIEEEKYVEVEEIEHRIIDINSIENKVKKNEFYVPNKKLFTSKTLNDFIKDFGKYDFKDEKYKKVLRESILVALEKDDEEKIKVKSYQYFKKVLENKINEFISNQSKSNIHGFKKTKFHNFNETFDMYSPEELDEIIEKSQREKFQ